MRWFIHTLKSKIYDHLIKPYLESAAPINEVALGTLIGIFVGFTPTVGIQMWIVLMIWLFCRFVLRIRFDLVIGTALVWISNPFTMFFMYYGFLVSGYFFYYLTGQSDKILSYNDFQSQLSSITSNPDLGYFDKVWDGTVFLLYDLGVPMILGSLFWATPLAVISYFVIKRYLLIYRKKQAQRMGISYEIWRERFEKSNSTTKKIIAN